MNLAKITSAAKEIERLDAALKWLKEYGVRISSADEAAVTIHLNFAGSCSGSKEAAAVLSQKASSGLPGLIADAITDCRNTIEIHRQTIRDECA